MLAFPSMLVEAAKKAGMAVPRNPDKFDPSRYPHFDVFCKVQLGRPLTDWSEHWHNAEVVAKIPKGQIKKVTLGDLLADGLKFST